MSKRINRLTSNWASATEIGRRFGLSAIAVGKFLTEAGLRQDGRPTADALTAGVATPLHNGTEHFMWNRQKVTAMLDAAGLPRVSEAERHVARVVTEVRAVMTQARDHGGSTSLHLAWALFDDMMLTVPATVRDKVQERVEKLSERW